MIAERGESFLCMKKKSAQHCVTLKIIYCILRYFNLKNTIIQLITSIEECQDDYFLILRLYLRSIFMIGFSMEASQRE